ncbi:MAG: TonB family protein [Verrucomicrobia bacterium]|nr:TonB family protein [Verrucomicrobiota bacterium]
MRRAWLIALAFSLTAHAAIVVVCLQKLIIPARVEIAPGDGGDQPFHVALVEVAVRDELTAARRDELTVAPPAPDIVVEPDPPDELIVFKAPPDAEPKTITGDNTATAESERLPLVSQAAPEKPSADAGAPGTRAEPLSRRNRPPAYPVIARRQGWEGTVVLDVDVLADGRVSAVTVACSSGHEVLDRAATDAVRRWLFRPAMRLGEPIADAVRVPVRFQLVPR